LHGYRRLLRPATVAASSPPDSQAAYTTVDRARAAVHAVPGAHALVGGTTAINLDVARASTHDNKLLIPLILAVVFLILGLLLRALVAPLILIATVVLSFAAALGVSAFFFNYVFHFGGADTAFPLYVFVFLVALGIDYNIFLMTRVREEADRRDARRGAITGLAATGGVITSAGFVLAGTFAVLATLDSTAMTEVGFAVAFGILLDTIVVRSVLVTALNLDVGRWMWWPSKLAHRPDPAPAQLSHERVGALAATAPGTAGGRRQLARTLTRNSGTHPSCVAVPALDRDPERSLPWQPTTRRPSRRLATKRSSDRRRSISLFTRSRPWVEHIFFHCSAGKSANAVS
jgi:predicted RND superfamily exporter protein